MSSTTLRHYKVTLAYKDGLRDRRINDFKRRFRTRISRRRFKQGMQSTLHRLGH